MLMNRAIAIYAGIIVTILASSVGLVFIPDIQLSQLQPHTDDMGNVYPIEPWGDAAQGRKVYIDLGCLYCHSQQVRREGFGSDIERGWGTRQTVARDYIFDKPHLLGTMRTGPDLANIGVRQPSETWQYQHLYNPQLTSPGSIMPQYPFLFDKVVVEPGEPAPADAVDMPEGTLPERTYLVPTDRGRNLVTYLKSLKHETPLPEAQ